MAVEKQLESQGKKICRLLNPVHQQRGLATAESVAMILVFVVIISYMMGMFGIVHTGILYSIAARTYAFETFRNRANTVYFRERSGAGATEHYQDIGIRVHGINSEDVQRGTLEWEASARPVAKAVAESQKIISGRTDTILNRVRSIRSGQRNEDIEVNPAWVRVRYGLCVHANCPVEQ